ncbi:MAG: extracellular solute-binding protein [Phycisphaerae bacterium]|nr:extracellular solute-binding protein [Phycisphaerae bacterium]
MSCASLFLLALVQSGCDRRPSVVVYVSADESVARPILIEFERTSGVRVDPVFDTEATKTTGLAQRLRSERDRPRADVFWSSEIAQTIRLAEEGVLMEAHSADLDAWPSQHRDPSSRWFSFAARARVIVYSTERVTKEEVPGTWMHLTRDRWRGRIAMADPRFGTTRTHMGVLASMWERRMMPGFFEAWLQGLHENQIALLTSGNGGVVEAIAHGQFDIGMTDTDDVWAGQAQGWKIDLVYPRHVAQADEPTGGTLLIPNTCALVAQPLTDAKRHAAALQLLEYLLSPAVERALLNSPSRNIPLGPGLATEASGVTPPDPLQLDWGLAAGASDDAAARAASLLREPAVIAPGRDGADSESSASDLEAVDPVATKAPSQLVGRGA